MADQAHPWSEDLRTIQEAADRCSELAAQILSEARILEQPARPLDINAVFHGVEPLLMQLIFNRVETGPMPFFVRPIARGISQRVKSSFIGPQLKLHLDYMEEELGRSEWFAGSEFSAADVQMSFPVEAAKMRGGLDESRPRLMRFLQRIHDRPAYKKALERGGQYDFAS